MKSGTAPQPSLNNACRLKFNEFGLFPFRSPLLGEYLRFLFLQVLRCFTSLSIASFAYEFSKESYGITHKGLPHSEISGSKSVCDSPKPIAAYHVLHRLLTPSHPPQTLRSLTLLSFSRAKPFRGYFHIHGLCFGVCNVCLFRDITFLKMLRLTLYEIVKEQKFSSKMNPPFREGR